MQKQTFAIETLNWDKVNGLIPTIIQDNHTHQVLMMGYMDKQALRQTCDTGKVTFYSRTKQRLWKKGEISGNELTLVNILPDCDHDTLLIRVKPLGPCCHLNHTSCFGAEDAPGLGILAKLETLLEQRFLERPQNSYVTTLFDKGIQRIAQKVGEEGVEVALASVTSSKEEIINEAADLIFHLLILLMDCRIDLLEVLRELHRRTLQPTT